MPRRDLLYAPGTLHHVTARGVERRKTFLGKEDGEDFLRRLEKTVSAGGRSIRWRNGAWGRSWTAATRHAILPHLLGRSGTTSEPKGNPTRPEVEEPRIARTRNTLLLSIAKVRPF